MSKSNQLFLIFCLVILSGIMHGYEALKSFFSPVQEQAAQISRLEREAHIQKIQIAKYEDQLLDYQQQVAAVLPSSLGVEKKAGNFQLRSIASIAHKPLESIDLSSVIMERAKSQFRKKEYDLASRSLVELLDKYPATPLQIEANFFMAESYFMLGRHQECLDIVDKMMTQYPDNELTGFIMLRMGQILHKQGRTEEATEVFRIVSHSFSQNQELKKQAQGLEKSIE